MTSFNTNSDKSAFSDNLKRLMKKNNLKNVDLAAMLDVSKSAISNYLYGTSKPKMEILTKIAGIFDVTIESLLSHNTGPETIQGSNIILTNSDTVDFFREEDIGKISFYQAPMFINQLVSSDIIYIEQNYSDRMLSTFPFHGDYDCYAVRITDNLLSSSGLPERSVVIYAATKEAENGDLAAILYKEKLQILIRRIEVKKNEIILSTDKTSETYKYNTKNDKVVVLGKVVSTMVFQ